MVDGDGGWWMVEEGLGDGQIMGEVRAQMCLPFPQLGFGMSITWDFSTCYGTGIILGNATGAARLSDSCRPLGLPVGIGTVNALSTLDVTASHDSFRTAATRSRGSLIPVA